jgi:hypothetical protein
MPSLQEGDNKGGLEGTKEEEDKAVIYSYY